MAEFVRVATLDEVPNDAIKAVRIGTHRIALVNAGGRLYAVSNICTHALCSFSYGLVQGMSLICTCHGAEFSVVDGRPLDSLGQAPLTCYEVRVEGTEITVGIP